jgi:hypothetical protein
MHAEAVLGHPPFTRPDGTPLADLEDRYLGQRAVLICGGPSFGQADHGAIRGSGLVTMTLDNGVRSFRSDLWLGVETPAKFDRTIWRDPAILKFVTAFGARHPRAAAGVNVVAYTRSERWCSEQIFAPDNPVDWRRGRSSGARTSMIDAIRVLFLLGFRTIYLFGVDFHQSRSYGYHHRAPGFRWRIAGNNRIYRNLSERFTLLRPLMEAAGLHLYNCNPASRLEAFEKAAFPGDAAVAVP